MHLLRRGLTASQLKWIALFFMTLDHLAAYGHGIPLFGRYYTLLRAAGRIAAPLFLFVLVQGARHTRSRLRFALRLYLAGMCTGLFAAAVTALLGENFDIFIPGGDIFFTFFYVLLYTQLIEWLLQSIRSRRPRAVLTSAALLAAALALSSHALHLTLYHFFITGNTDPYFRIFASNLLDSFLPSLVSVEYGWGFVVLGVLLYFAGAKHRQCAVYAGFCFLCLAGMAFAPNAVYMDSPIASFANVFFDSFQCWMVLALPFMLLYNGQRGRGPKWFFYWYYPLHRCLIIAAEALLTG